MNPYQPLEQGKPAHLGGLFVRANDINTIMLSLAGDSAETRHLIFHEAVHWHLSALDTEFPLWLSEGLAEMYSTFEFPDSKHYSFGEPIRQHVRQLQSRKPLPMAQLISIAPDSLLYNEGSRVSIFYAQSWAFVHFLFYGQGSPGPKSVSRYLELLLGGNLAQYAFTNAFGGDYADLSKRLSRYITAGTFYNRVYPRITETNAPVSVSSATLAEMEIAKGSLLFGSRTPEAAESHLLIASQLAPDDPRPWELLGHVAIAQHNFVTAQSALSKAAASGSTSYLVFHNLAISRLLEAGAAGTPIKHSNPVDIDKSAADFRHAIELAPAHLPSYHGLAGLIYGMESFRSNDLTLLTRGLALSPHDKMIEVGIASCEFRAAKPVEGEARLRRILMHKGSNEREALDLARQILEAETLKKDSEEINRLAGENRFRDAIAVADQSLARLVEADNRQQMLSIRGRLIENQRIAEAVALSQHREHECRQNPTRKNSRKYH